jgi:outer membrane receptor protein involved in Fe transport
VPPNKRLLIAIAAVSQVATQAPAAERRAFAVAAGPLDIVLRSVADQAECDISYSKPAVHGLSSRGVQGIMSPRKALAYVLAGSGLKVREAGPGRYIIEMGPTPAAGSRPPGTAPTETETLAAEIVVTGSKRAVAEARFPGAVRIIPTGLSDPFSPGIHTSSELEARTPLLQSTAFGPGRDKLFVRGVADSSFAGPTQATVGHYFGDTRLLYSGSDPALRLVDTQQVEILEGPQGTLYGAGAIGGIVRIVPTAPDLDRSGYQLEASVAMSEQGRPGFDMDAALNLPIVSGQAAVRLVGYHALEGGYIANPTLGMRSINSSRIDGGRAAVRAILDSNWTIDVGALGQTIATADPQYAQRGFGPRSLAAALRQPYRDTIKLGSISLRFDDSSAPKILFNVGGVRRSTQLRLDASRPSIARPIAYDEHTSSNLIDGEVRVWQRYPSGADWLVGLSAVKNHTAAQRQLGPPDAQRDISGVDNRSLDLALFGEGTIVLGHGLTSSVGGRLTHARIDGQPLAAQLQSAYIRGEAHTRFDLTTSLAKQLTPGLFLYGRYAQGFRSGGLAVAAGLGRVAVYRPDSLTVSEAGIRADRLLGGKLSGTIGVSHARWQNIQADLVSRTGFPFTANIGDGRISALEASVAYRPIARLELAGEALFARSRLIHPEPGYERENGNDLPDTPRIGYSSSLSWFPPVDETKRLRATIAIQHEGHSRFGAGPLFGIDQGGYTTADVSATLSRGRFRFGLALENIANAQGDRFAVGNPFQMPVSQQYTPLRPRTFRMTITVSR